jgi:hypothetical protein
MLLNESKLGIYWVKAVPNLLKSGTATHKPLLLFTFYLCTIFTSIGTIVPVGLPLTSKETCVGW